jgi:trimeric autotransporter adhesin
MASITTRETGTTGTNGVTRKDLPLTNSEIDTNFISLNDNKLETSWTGNTNIVTLGTVATGTWNATTIATNKGGTGLTSFTNCWRSLCD